MTNNEKEELRKNFEMLDKDGDGMVCKNELYLAYKKLYNDKIKA
jgi:Ca2+-binding EF-hand superfamily protein